MRRAAAFAALLLAGVTPGERPLRAQAPAPAQPRTRELPRVPGAPPYLVASSEGIFSEFDEPSGSRGGWMVFHAKRDDRREGIYASSGSSPIPVAETGTAVDDGETIVHLQRFGRLPTVNDAFRVAFTAGFSEGGSAVLLSQSGVASYDFVADSTEAFRDFGELAAINSATHVVFRATLDPPNHPDRSDFDGTKLSDPTQYDKPETIPPPARLTVDGRRDDFDAGLFADRLTDLLVVADTSKGVLDVQDGFAFNDQGHVAFRAALRQKHWSLLVGPIGNATPVAETGDRFSALGLPAIDSRGRVAFVAQGVRGDASVCRSRIGSGLPEIVADATDGFAAFGPNVALDERGRVFFVASLADGRERLCVASTKGDAQEIVAAGDLVGRRPIAHLRLGNRPFARDRIALVVRLEPDVEAVVLVPVPR